VEEKAEVLPFWERKRDTMYLCLILKIKEKYKEVLINNGIFGKRKGIRRI
jgi:hypothetical protein